MKLICGLILIAGCACGQLTVSTNDIWRLKKGDTVVTNVTITGVVWTNDATYTGTVAKANSALQPADTNGWVVSSHSGLATTAQLGAYLPLAGGTMTGDITRQGFYADLILGATGLTLSAPPFGISVLMKVPDDIQGEFYFASREWTANQLTSKADATHTNDPAAHESLFALETDLTLYNNAAEAGRAWGGMVTATNATCYIASGGGYVKVQDGGLSSIPTSLTNGQGSALQYVSWAATNMTLATGYNIIFWDASAGAFSSCLKADMGTAFDFTRDFTVGRVYYDAQYGPVARLCGMNRWNKARRVQIFHEQIHPVEVGSGAVASASGLSFSVTSGEVWAEGENYFTTTAKTVTTPFHYWFKTNSVFTYTFAASTTNINVLQYNDITQADGLETMTANRWRVDYVYLVHDGSVHVVMGQNQYVSAALAEQALRPTPPDILSAYGTLIGRITVQKSATTMTLVNNDNVSFASASIPDHGGLAGLQGGTAGEYYHLTGAELIIATNPVHNSATGRELPNAHPTSAITGLDTFIGSAVTNGQSGTSLQDLIISGNGNITAGYGSSLFFTGGAAVDVAGMKINSGGGFRYFNGSGDSYGIFIDHVNNYTLFPATKLGLGTATPSEKLHVVGNTIITSNLTVSGISKIILPTSTNGLASGTVWDNNGNVEVQGKDSPFIAHTNATANAHPTSAITGLDSALVIATNRPAFQVFTGLTGNITLTNNLEAPISISGTGSISVAFSGLVSPYPVYLTAQGFSSLTFPAGSYLVGGGMWQTNRVNHFVVWQYSTNLYVNPVVTTEIE